MTFHAGYKPPTDHNNLNRGNLWFVFKQGRLLIKESAAGYEIPDRGDLGAVLPALDDGLFFGILDSRSCYAAGIVQDVALPDPMAWIDPRMLFGSNSEELFWVAGRANQLADWQMNHRFCGRCGGQTKDKEDERAKICPACGVVNFPRLSPAVITAVLRNDRILLARNKNFRSPMFSVLAGFVEPGETLEDCVRREIREEVGIDVKNIKYFASQPWPFPNSLMIGFVAEYAAGEISVDDVEIAEAGWFRRDDLPPIPPSISIARRLIDWFVDDVEVDSF